MTDFEPGSERIRRILSLAVLACLGILVYAVVSPFLVALVWAVILVMSLWPPYLWLRGRLSGRQGLAAGLMAAAVALGIIVPVALLSLLAAQEAASLGARLQGVLSGQDQELAKRLGELPGIGRWLENAESFNTFLEQNRDKLVELVRWVMASLTRGVFKFVVCVFATYFLFRHGDRLAVELRTGLRRIGGERASELLVHVRATVRGVVYGLVMTAIAQAILAAFGFWVAGVPYPLLLGGLMLIVSFIPFGPPVVWLPASLGLFMQGDTLWGILLFIWGAGVISTIDNILRPLFIGQATRLPVLLVFIGVLGGIMGFGLVGLFVGPVVMAVALALWRDWVDKQDGEFLSA